VAAFFPILRNHQLKMPRENPMSRNAHPAIHGGDGQKKSRRSVPGRQVARS
jgi:hypothetical protein